MSYYADLTPHTYVRDGSDEGAILNIGWLDREHEFARGDVPGDFLETLRELCLRPVHLHRGSHQCQFCGNFDWTFSRSIGNGQIRVLSREGIWYAAPTMVQHYVITHQYRPPDAFIDAVREPSAVACGRLIIPPPFNSRPANSPQVVLAEPPKVLVLKGMPIDAWRIDKPPSPRLSPGTRRRLEIVFAKEDQPAAEAILADGCGNLPGHANELERVRYAAMKVSNGDLERLKKAVDLGKRDYRDLLMAAGFGEVTAHERWLAEPGTISS